MPFTTLGRNRILNALGFNNTTVTTGASSATQTVGTTAGMLAGSILYFNTAAVFRVVSSVTNSTTVVLTSSISSTTNEVVDVYTAFPTTLYIGLFTATPGLSGGGTEVSGNAYARQAAAFSVAASGVITSNAGITFPTPTPSSWGTVTYWGAFDASTSGNLWFFENIQKPVTNETGSMSSGIYNLAEGSAALGGLTNPVASVVVKYGAGYTSTAVEGTDYIVQYDTGVIIRISTGALSASQALEVTYLCADSEVVGVMSQFQIPSGNLSIAFKSFIA